MLTPLECRKLPALSAELEQVSKIDFLGWLAAAMVLVTFYLKTMTPLRVVAIGSNVLFIFFGLLSQTLPIMVLHCLLLPLNVYRLVEIRQKRKWASRCPISELSQAMLLPLMAKDHAPPGSLLFSKGERADKVYLLLSGEIWLRHGEALVQPGQLFGLMGVFSADHRRTDTAECKTEVEFALISTARFWEVVDQHPQLGADLMQTIARRQLGTLNAGRARTGTASPVEPGSGNGPIPAGHGAG